MAVTPERWAFDRVVGPFLGPLLPDEAQDVLRYRPDPAVQEQIEKLAAKSTEGQLTDEERSEYEGYVRANKFIAIVQRQARRSLKSAS